MAGRTEGTAPERDIIQMKCLGLNSSVLTGVVILYGTNLSFNILKSAKNHVFFF